jgi:hypothetical protein
MSRKVTTLSANGTRLMVSKKRFSIAPSQRSE